MTIDDQERKRRGHDAESYICRKMIERGCQIVERNYSAGKFGEIDIIASYGSKLLFVDVRARQADSRFGSPLESISRAKIRKIRNSIKIYLQNNRIMNRFISILAAAVYMDSSGQIIDYDIVTVESL